MQRPPSPFVFVEESADGAPAPDGTPPRTLRGYVMRIRRRLSTASSSAQPSSRTPPPPSTPQPEPTPAEQAAELLQAELETLLAGEGFADIRLSIERFVQTQIAADPTPSPDAAGRLLAAYVQGLAWELQGRLPAHFSQRRTETALAAHIAEAIFAFVFGPDPDIAKDAQLYDKIADLQGVPRSFWMQAPSHISDASFETLAERLPPTASSLALSSSSSFFTSQHNSVLRAKSPSVTHEKACSNHKGMSFCCTCDNYTSPPFLSCLFVSSHVLSCHTGLCSMGSKAGEMISADLLLPVLITGIVHGNPPSLWSNLQFVCRFCPQQELLGESGLQHIVFSAHILPSQLIAFVFCYQGMRWCRYNRHFRSSKRLMPQAVLQTCHHA